MKHSNPSIFLRLIPIILLSSCALLPTESSDSATAESAHQEDGAETSPETAARGSAPGEGETALPEAGEVATVEITPAEDEPETGRDGGPEQETGSGEIGIEPGVANTTIEAPPETGEATEPQTEEVLSQIELALSVGDVSAAIEAYEEARLDEPDEPETQVLYAGLLLMAGQNDQAEDLLLGVLESSPENADALYYMALIAGTRGDMEAHEDYLERTVDAAPEYHEAYAALGDVRLRRRETPAARQAYETAISIDPNSFVAIVGLANVNIRQGNQDRAEELLTRAIELRPDYPFAYMDRAAVRMNTRSMAGALRDLDRAIALLPDYPWNYVDRARTRAEVGNHEGAIEDYDRAIELTGSVFLLYANRGRSYEYLGQFDKAAEDYERALEIEPDYLRELAPGLGTAYYVLGRYNDAADAFQTAFDNSPDLYSFLLLAASALGYSDAREQRRYLESVVPLIPRDSIYYEVGRFYITPAQTQDGFLLQNINSHADTLERTQAQFYLAEYYRRIGRASTAHAMYLEIIEEGTQGLIEWRLAQWRINSSNR